MSRKLPDTSISAYHQVHPEMKKRHHEKIIEALQTLGLATYEEIAAFCTMDRHQIGRRLSELEKDGIVYKPGGTKPTKSGRQAYQYCLAKSGERTTIEKTKGKSTADHASELIEKAKDIINFEQLDLFSK